MPTMNEVIERVDTVKPNAYSDEAKCRWIAAVDGMVSEQVLDMKEPVTYRLPEDADKPLLVGDPYGDIYELYVAAMIDFHNREYNNYNNTVLLFSNRIDAYKAWYIRNHNPSRATNFRNVMG